MQPRENWLTRERLRSGLLLAATAIAVFVCYRLVRPFFPALAWALAFAVVGRPMHRFLQRRLRRKSIAAILSATGIVIVLVIPTFFVARQLAKEVARGAQVIEAEIKGGEIRAALASDRRFASAVRVVERNIDVNGLLNRTASGLAHAAQIVIAGSVREIVQLALAVFILFYLLRDEAAVLTKIRSLMPLSDAESSQLFQRISETVHATIAGSITVAAVQGLLGGLVFAFLGLPAPIVWGVVMFVLSVVPMLGSSIVWAPAAIYLALQGNWGKGLFLMIYGLTVIGLIDNFLYPMLVGHKLRFHPPLVLLFVLGGIMLFGPSGVILGPATLATTAALLETWSHRAGPAGNRSGTAEQTAR